MVIVRRLSAQSRISRDSFCEETMAARYWAPKEISLKDVALDMTYAVLVVFLARAIGGFFGNLIPYVIGTWLGVLVGSILGA